MPHFTREVEPTNGSLMLIGLVGVSSPRHAALISSQQPVPQEVRVLAMVDTGASSTCVDPAVLEKLGLSPTGQVQVSTPSTGADPHSMDQYDISLRIITKDPSDALVRPVLPVIASHLTESQGFEVLLGRDVLSDCLIVYNGLEGYFSFAY